MDLEITPEPDEDERDAIEAALDEPRDAPDAYRSGWRRDSLEEQVDPFES